MALNSKSALRLGLVAVAAVSMAACQSRPKPSFPTAPKTTPQAQPARPGGGIGQTTTPPPAGQAAVPGSLADFVAAAGGDRVFFDYDSYDVRSDATATLDAQASWLRRYPAVRVRIEGNADERGTREYNLALGARRANAVRDYLVGRGVTSDRVSTISYGKEQPIDGGTSDEAHARNRNAHTALVSGAR